MNLFLRKASIEDGEIILEWRNDAATRKNSFSKEIIDPDTHLKWYQGKLTDQDCSMYILMDSSEKIGLARIDKIGKIGKISYMISPAKRKMGYGRKMLELLENNVPGDIKVLVGFVENSNEPSKRCFISNHYTELVEAGCTCYIKTL